MELRDAYTGLVVAVIGTILAHVAQAVLGFNEDLTGWLLVVVIALSLYVGAIRPDLKQRC